MAKTVLCIDKSNPFLIEALRDNFTLVVPEAPDPEEVILSHKNDIQAVVTYMTPVRCPLMKALPNLEIILCAAAGFDHIDCAAAQQRGVTVSNMPELHTADTADVALSLLMNVMRRAVEGDVFVRAGLWRSKSFPLSRSLSGKRLGIVGMGRIGQAIAKRAEVFGVEISYCSRTRKEELPYQFFENLQALAKQSDILLLACPGGDETRHIVNETILEALGRDGYLINIARGSVVNEEDLLIALRNKTIAGAGLDVYENEPNVPEALFSMDNVVLSPHVGSSTMETRRRMGQAVVERLQRYFEGHPLKHVV